MGAEVPRWRTVGIAALVSVGAMLGGCSADGSGSEADSASDSVHARTSPGQVPASQSGGLGQEHLPDPAALGAGWEYRVDQGNAEDGYRGSGQPATARQPRSVLDAITPLGCRPAHLPVPKSALDVTYAKASTPGVGLLLRFADETRASRFFTRHAGVLARCVDSDAIDLTVLRASDSLVVSTRAEDLGQTPTWTEGMSLRRTDVMFVAVADRSKAAVRSVVAALT